MCHLDCSSNPKPSICCYTYVCILMFPLEDLLPRPSFYISSPRIYFTYIDKAVVGIKDAERFKVGDPRKFHYLNQSKCIELNGVDDCKEYLGTKKAMEVVGINSEEQVLISSCYVFYFTFVKYSCQCFCGRMQFSEWWQQFSTWETLSSKRGVRQTLLNLKMIKLGFT